MSAYSDWEIKTLLQNWPALLQRYTKSDPKKGIAQMLSSYVPFVMLWVAMYYSLKVSYWITLALAFINAFFLVRIFIIQHDCGHRSFFSSKKWNNIVGWMCSFFSTIPFQYWARVHDFHHGHCGQLETRDIGDINTLTAREYAALSPMGKLRYRLFRMPLITFVVGPIYYLLVNNRLPLVQMKGWTKVYWSQLWNNISIAAVFVLLCWVLGTKTFLLVHLPIIVFFSIIAVWFFYVQHQHEHNFKAWKADWNYLLAAIKGSTFYKLPGFLHWMTGHIGYHHIHHLQPGIPSYHLKKCFQENEILNRFVTQVTFRESLSYIHHKLWDEQMQRMITFREFRQRRREFQ